MNAGIPVTTYIHEIMADTATHLKRSLDVYWPTNVGHLNDLPERNLSAHFSHAMLKRNFHLYAETNNQFKPEKELLDILCISPDKKYHITCEFKTYTSGSMKRSDKDVERVISFPLNIDLSPEIFGPNYVAALKGCNVRVGLVAGILWRKKGQSAKLNGRSQMDFVNKVTSLGGVIIEDPILVKEYTPEMSSPASDLWSGGYYLYYAILGNTTCEVDGEGNLLKYDQEVRLDSFRPDTSRVTTEESILPQPKSFKSTATPETSNPQPIPAILFHPKYRCKLTKEEEARLEELEQQSAKTKQQIAELDRLKTIRAVAFTGSKFDSQYNKRVRTYKQGCWDDGKYLFYSPEFCNQEHKSTAKKVWVATYDQSGKSVWVCSSCLSVYPRKEKLT